MRSRGWGSSLSRTGVPRKGRNTGGASTQREGHVRMQWEGAVCVPGGKASGDSAPPAFSS
jgi:hypothetical protein